MKMAIVLLSIEVPATSLTVASFNTTLFGMYQVYLVRRYESIPCCAVDRFPSSSCENILDADSFSGNTLLLSSIQLSVMLPSLLVYYRQASSQRSLFSIMSTFIVSTIPALLALLLVEVILCPLFILFLPARALANMFDGRS